MFCVSRDFISHFILHWIIRVLELKQFFFLEQTENEEKISEWQIRGQVKVYRLVHENGKKPATGH